MRYRRYDLNRTRARAYELFAQGATTLAVARALAIGRSTSNRWRAEWLEANRRKTSVAGRPYPGSINLSGWE